MLTDGSVIDLPRLAAALRSGFRLRSGQRGPNFWHREVVLAAVVLPAGVSFAANALAARNFGLELFGLWIVWRSAVQLTANVTPGFNVGVTVLLPRYQKSGDQDLLEFTQRVADRAVGAWGALGVSAVTPVAFILLDQPAEIIWAIVALWLGTLASGYTNCVARGRRDGTVILSGSLTDALGAGLCIAATFTGSLAIFIWTQAARRWGRAVVQYRIPSAVEETGESGEWMQEFRKLVKVGFPLTVRGWVQSAAQYGDRLVIGTVFGAAVVGAAGLGSMLALPSVMLASTAGAWLLPILIAGGGDEAQKAFGYEMLTIGLAILGGVLVLPLYPFVVPESAPDMALLVLAYLLICQLSLLVPVLTPMIAAGRIWRAAGLHGGVVAALAATIIGAGTAGLTPFVSLSLAVVVGFVGVGGVILLSPIGQYRFSRQALMGTVVGGSLVLIGYAHVSDVLVGAPVLAVPVGILGAALLALAGWRVISRPDVGSGDDRERRTPGTVGLEADRDGVSRDDH